MKRKHKPTPEQAETTRRILRQRITPGERREVYLCKTCKKIQAHDFIPFGLGRGVWFNMCHDNAVSSNWIFNQAILLGGRTARHPKRQASAASRK